MKKRLMVLAMAGIMVTGLVSSANIVSADDKEASGLEGKRIGVCLVYKGDEWCAAVADEFEKQKIYKNKEILKNIIYLGLRAKLDTILKKYRCDKGENNEKSL